METRKSVLEMSHEEVKEYFLKEESYSSIGLPQYFTFEKLLRELDKKLPPESNISDIIDKNRLNNIESTNYTIYANKDGKLSWRPLQLIHPLLYLKLVRAIANEKYWSQIKERFQEFQKNDKIRCLSIPVESVKSEYPDKREQILQWWEGIEQESISLSLEYRYVYDTDVADCYGSIYTHSIAWAVHNKEQVKKNRNEKLWLGNIIDDAIQSMQYRQTNGIPQGSVLMDFIAEIVLGYIDTLLTEEIKEKGIDKYQILRYRDDYKIFVNSSYDGVEILKLLSQVMIPFGFKLNSSKTKETHSIITSSVKPDKLAWLKLNSSEKSISIQKELLLIHQHSLSFPNSGSLIRALNRIIGSAGKTRHPVQVIAIALDIMMTNPKTVPSCCSIISNVLNTIKDKGERERLSHKIYNKVRAIPNSGLAQIWIQRMLKEDISKFPFDLKLCEVVEQAPKTRVSLWDNSWIRCDDIKKVLENRDNIFSRKEFEQLKSIIDESEISVFSY